MYIPKDNDMLFSMVNMKLRDEYDSLEEFCECEDIDPASLLVRLNAAGYEYDEEHNKFTPILDPLVSSEDSVPKENSVSTNNSNSLDNSSQNILLK